MYVKSTEPISPYGSRWSAPKTSFVLCGSLKSFTKYESDAAEGADPVVHDVGCAAGSATKLGTPAPEQLGSNAPVPVFEYTYDIQLYGSRPVKIPARPRIAVPSRTSQWKPSRGDHCVTGAMNSLVLIPNLLAASASFCRGASGNDERSARRPSVTTSAGVTLNASCA